jgi:hypothetical protein
LRLYLHWGELALAAMCLRRVRVAGSGIAAGAPPLAHLWTLVRPSVPAAKYLGVGLWWPYRRETEPLFRP